MSVFDEVCAAAKANNKTSLYELLNNVKEETEKAKLLSHAIRNAAFVGNTVLVNALINDKQADIRDALCGAVEGNQGQYVHNILSNHKNLIHVACYYAEKFERNDLAEKLEEEWKPDYNLVACHAICVNDQEVVLSLLEDDFGVNINQVVEWVVGPYYNRDLAEYLRVNHDITADFMLKKAWKAGNKDYVNTLVPAVLEEHRYEKAKLQEVINVKNTILKEVSEAMRKTYRLSNPPALPPILPSRRRTLVLAEDTFFPSQQKKAKVSEEGSSQVLAKEGDASKVSSTSLK